MTGQEKSDLLTQVTA